MFMRRYCCDNITNTREERQMASERWKAIREFEYPEDSDIIVAVRLASDCDDCDLIGSLCELDAALARGAGDDEREQAEDSVKCSLAAIEDAFRDE